MLTAELTRLLCQTKKQIMPVSANRVQRFVMWAER